MELKQERGRDLFARLAQKEQFAAFRHRGFRLIWIATVLTSTARWADLVIIGWLTLELTNSPFWVGIVAGSKMAGYVAAPFMGVVADRLDRRKILIWSAAVNCTMGAILLFLIVSDLLLLWHVIVLALASSLIWALDNPTRNALVPDLVSKETLSNAIALKAVAMEITVVAGPALGGILIPTLGMGGAYALIAAIYLIDVIVLSQLARVKQSSTEVEETPAKSLVAGFRYVLDNRTVFVLLTLAFLMNLFAAPYRYSFLPLFARYVLDAGPTAYGMLTATAGVGALVAGVWVVSMGNFRHRGRLLLWNALAWPFFLVLFSASTSYSASLVLIFLAGLTQAVTWTVVATLIISNTAAAMRGRVMGLRTGVVIGLPIGNFIAGGFAERIGAQWALGAYAAVAFLIVVAVAIVAPSVRRLD